MDQRYGKSGASILKIYDRRPGTKNQGIDFETNITALVALRCIALEDTEDMWMGSNVAQFGDFDDIVLYRRTTEGRRLIYMLQLKHQENPKNIAKSEFQKDSGDFSVSKYSKTFNSLKEQLVGKKTDEHEVIQYLREVDDRVFVLYTNKGVDEFDFLEKHYDHTLDFLDTSSSKENRFKFNSEFPEKVILFSNQIHVNDTINLTKEEIKHMLGSSFNLSAMTSNKVVIKFLDFIRTWEKGTKINKSQKYFTLTKSDVINKLTDILLSPYRYKLSNESFRNGQEKPVWNKVVQDKNITVVDSDESVGAFLNQYIAGEVRKHLRGFEKSWIEKLTKKTLQFIRKKDEDLVMNLLKMNGNPEKITMLDLYASLWFTNRIPLLLEVDTMKDYEDILKILNLSNYSLHVIIIKNKTLKLDHKIVSTIKYFITCDDLNQEEKSIILNQPIKLQNRPNHTLGNVIDESMYKFVSCKDVIRVLQENFNVGNEYELFTDFHIERTLSRVFLEPVVLRKIKDEIFILKSQDIGCLRHNEIGFSKNVIHVTKSKTLEEEKWRGSVIHEVIIYGDGNLEWKRSFGTTKNILKYVKQQKKVWIDFQDDQNYFLNGLHVITATPGMGKTTFTDFMAVRVPANIWVIKIVLNKYEEYYENIQHKSGSDLLKFFKDQLLHKCKNLELSNAIFQKRLDAKKVLVIFDGFDEIGIDFEEIVINIANCLQDEGFPLWLTTRPNRKYELEGTLCTIALTLNPLTVDDQRTYLNKYFSDKCTSGNLNNQELVQSFIRTFVDRLMEKVKYNFNDRREKFMAIPLHVKLLAEVFSADCEKSFQTGSIILNGTFHLVDLYERFIKRKIDIVCEKFGNDARKSRRYIEKHQKLFAIKYLYPEKRVQQLKINEQLKEYYIGEEFKMYFLQREGIVVVEQKSNGEKLHYNFNFTHRTFAEYLAAQWFSEYFSNPDWGRILTIPDIFHKEKLIYYMFNLILSKDFPLHVAILTGNFDEAKKVLETDLTRASELDKGGRTVLHIIAITGNVNLDERRNMLETISNYTIRDTKDLIRTFTALDYAVANREYRLANQMCELFPNLAVTSTISSTFLLLECANNTYNSLFKAALRYAISSHLLADSRDKNLSVRSYLLRIPYEQQNRSILHYTREFDPITISEFFQFKNQSNDSPIGHYYYDLDIACALGTEENVNYLLSKGAQTNSSNFETSCLHYAARHNRLEIVKLLLDNGAKIDSLNETGQSALHWAASSDIVTELLAKGANINKVDINHDTPLSIALKNGKLDIARLLVLQGANCNLENTSGYSSLHCAAQTNCLEIVTELLSKGVSINQKNKDGDTPLNIALSNRNLDVAKLLLLKGANCNLENTSGYSSLHYAAQTNCPEIVTEILSKGVSINQKHKDGDTPLNIALSNRNLDVAKLLLLKGANSNLENTSGYSSLHYAAQTNCPEIVTELLLKGASINQKTNDDDTPLSIALSKSNVDIAKLLLLNGANCNLGNTSGYSSLHYAAQTNCPEIVTELLLKGACINQQNKNGDTPLSIALSKSNLDIAKLLLLKGANCNLKNTFGDSSLHCAAQSNCPDIIAELLSKGVCINQKNMYGGDTPLHIALRNRNVDIARFLLLKGANCNVENGRSSLLHYAARSNNCADVITELLSKGISVNAQDVMVAGDGDTPLHIAVEYFATDTAGLLLSKGADINLQNNYGQTPLHIAVIEQLYYPKHIPFDNRISLVRFLLEKGADLNIRDNYGDTPLAYNASEDESLFAGDEADLNLFKQVHNEAKILLLERGAGTSKKN